MRSVTNWEQHTASLTVSHLCAKSRHPSPGLPCSHLNKCLTLSPVVALQVELATPEHKQNLADALFNLKIQSSGSINEDIKKLSAEIARWGNSKLLFMMSLTTINSD